MVQDVGPSGQSSWPPGTRQLRSVPMCSISPPGLSSASHLGRHHDHTGDCHPLPCAGKSEHGGDVNGDSLDGCGHRTLRRTAQARRPRYLPGMNRHNPHDRTASLRVGGCQRSSTHPKTRQPDSTVQQPTKWATITGVASLPCTLNLGRASGGENVTMQKWTKPVLVKLDIAETLRGSGPCPDGDGGSEAM